jgi:membrane-associated phospholipid phosphatase
MTNPQRATAAMAASAFIALTTFVWLHPVVIGDARIGQRLLTVPGTPGWHVATAVSFVASGPVVALVAIVAAAWTALRLRRPAQAIAIVVAPAVAGAIEVALKSLVGRARPLSAAISGETGNGYPSGHVTGFTALVVVLLVVWVRQPDAPSTTQRRTACIAVGFAVALVAWSRVALGVHYASDTLGAALLGVTVGLLCPWLGELIWSQWRGRTRVLARRSG